MALDQIIRLIYQSDTSQASGALGGLSKQLQEQRELWKRSILENNAANAAARLGTLELIQVERQRSIAAKIGLAEQVLAEKQRIAALKQTEAATLGVARAQAQLDGLRSRQSVQGSIDAQQLQSARDKAAIARRQYQLRLQEQKESPDGLSGLERMFQFAGAGNAKLLSAGVQQFGGLFGGMVPGPLGQAIGMARNFAQAGGLFTEGMSAATLATTGLTVALGAGGLVGAFVLATKSAAYLQEALTKASQEEITAIGQSSEIQRIYEMSQSQADKFYRDLQISTELAGKNTSVSGDEIARLNNIVLPSLLKIGKESGTEASQLPNRIVDLTKRFAILAQATPSVTPFQVTGALSAATSGQLDEAVKSQEFFKNSGLDKIIREEAQKKGVDLAKATAAQQVEIFEAAIKTRVPEALIDRAQGAVVSQISELTDTLFAPRTGVFGVMRDVVKDVNGNLIEGTSVYDSFAKLVKTTIGREGILANLADIFNLADFDTMSALREAIEGLNDFLSELNKLFKSIADIRKFIANIGFGKIPGTNIQANVGGFAGAALDAANPFPEIWSLLRQGAKIFGDGINPIPEIQSLWGNISKLWGARFAGNLPGNTDEGLNFFAALNAEVANMPQGAKPVIANDSEYIFPSESDVLRYAASRSSQVTIAAGAIVVNASPNQSPGDIASTILDMLDQRLSLAMNSYA